MRVFHTKHEHSVFFVRIVVRDGVIYVVLFCPTCRKRFVDKIPL